MNYIKRLQAENKELKEKNEALLEIFQEIRVYLNSPKFQGIENHYVNPDDILKRISDGLHQID